MSDPELVMGWVHPWVGLGLVRVFFLIFGGLGWVETWLRDIFNVMKYFTVC